MKSDNKIVIQNTAMLYIMNIAKMILPLVTLPYLTRVLSVSSYAVVTYVKSCMVYMQLIVDFGFLLSATKEIITYKSDREKLSRIVGDTVAAKLMLSAVSFCVMLVMTFTIDILEENKLFSLLSFGVVFLSAFIPDFLFRGLEKMHIITVRYMVSKLVSTGLTFVFVRSEKDILWIPVLDILSSFIAILMTVFEMKKLKISFHFTGIGSCFRQIRTSAVYFLSDIATTAFSALNTLLIGMFIMRDQVAYWSVALQLITAAQNLYSPIMNGIYPRMLETKDFSMIRKILKIFMPLICIAVLFCLIFAKPIILIINGEKYLDAIPVFRALLPLLILSFPSMIFGWPSLGAINRAKETTKTTVSTAIAQIIGILILIAVNQFTILNLALLRCITEGILLFLRYRYCRIYRNEFRTV